MIIIENKFEIGQEVFTIIQKPVQTKCNLCDGNKFIVHKEVKIVCPQCKGKGDIIHNTYTAWEVMPPTIISSMRISHNREENTIRYNLNNGCRRVEYNVFSTYEDAQNRCNELNKVVE